MPFSQFESQVNARAIAQFIAARRPPENIRARLDLAVVEKPNAFEVVSIYPHALKKAETVYQDIARVRYYRSRDEWHLYWKRADGKWYLYEPSPIHLTLHTALKTVDEDKHCCFFG